MLLLLAVAVASDEETFGDDGIAVVSVSGPILDIGSQLDWIRKISDNPRIKGVLLRVDSPGGGAAASQELYTALKGLAATRPVAVSMGSTAASGGVMVAMAGTRIFANASTVTGSIGVRMDIPQLGPLLDKIGIGQETLTTAPYKDAGSPLKPLTPEQRAYFKAVLDDMHAQFVDIVATGRKMPRDKAAALADGRIFTGREALRLGLVDELGGQAEDGLLQGEGIIGLLGGLRQLLYRQFPLAAAKLVPADVDEDAHQPGLQILGLTQLLIAQIALVHRFIHRVHRRRLAAQGEQGGPVELTAGFLCPLQIFQLGQDPSPPFCLLDGVPDGFDWGKSFF